MDTLGNIITTPFICIGWIIAGAIAGALANRIMHSRASLVVDIITGWIGAFVGNWLLSLLNIRTPDTGFTGFLATILAGILGAVVVIAVTRALRGRRV